MVGCTFKFYALRYAIFFRRYVQSEELFLEIRETVLSMNPELRIGGNALVIAQRMVAEGADVLLAMQNEKVCN